MFETSSLNMVIGTKSKGIKGPFKKNESLASSLIYCSEDA
ncbi:hypothetical protein OIU79_028503 [Salix purpurea]|uniref:Uncharacterized protein n=1 Tax=Salix purpurea TaxID=77065 RepID=A0A9Q1A2T0_SALPP|nr:hypothetical protein OIU79_028503 [Salix purpurea]